MHALDAVERVPDASSHGLTGPLRLVRHASIATTEAQRGGELRDDEVVLELGSLRTTEISTGARILDVGLERKEPASVLRFRAFVEDRLATRHLYTFALGLLCQLEDVELDARSREQPVEIGEALRVS